MSLSSHHESHICRVSRHTDIAHQSCQHCSTNVDSSPRQCATMGQAVRCLHVRELPLFAVKRTTRSRTDRRRTRRPVSEARRLHFIACINLSSPSSCSTSQCLTSSLSSPTSTAHCRNSHQLPFSSTPFPSTSDYERSGTRLLVCSCCCRASVPSSFSTRK